MRKAKNNLADPLNGCRAFITKIRNASRFVTMNLKGEEDFNIDFARLTDPDKWILHALNNLVVKINEQMDNYRIDKVAYLLYHFFRHEYCDWYLEFSKSDLHNPETRKTLKLTLYRLLQLLHPFIPFVTAELFQNIKSDGQPLLLQTEFPTFTSEAVFSREFTEVEALKKIITETRKTRARNIIHPGNRIHICLKTESEKEKAALSRNMKYFDSLTRSAKTEIVPDFSHLPKGFRGSCLNWEILLPLDSDEHRRKELTRLNQELEKMETQAGKLEKKLSNNRFLKKSPASVVLQLKKDLRGIIDRRDRTRETIHDLS